MMLLFLWFSYILNLKSYLGVMVDQFMTASIFVSFMSCQALGTLSWTKQLAELTFNAEREF